MHSTIKRWLGKFVGIPEMKTCMDSMQRTINELRDENTALRPGTAVVTPDGKVAKAEPPPQMPARSRVRSYSQYSRQREAQAWRDLCDLAFPNANTTTKRPD